MTFQDRLTKAFNAENKRRERDGEPRLTKTDVWKVAGKSSGAASHWFGGSNGMDMDTCIKVAPLLKIDPGYLFDGTKPSTKALPDEAPHYAIYQVSTDYQALTAVEKEIVLGFRHTDDRGRNMMLLVARQANEDFSKREGNS